MPKKGLFQRLIGWIKAEEKAKDEAEKFSQEFIKVVKPYIVEVAEALKSKKGNVTYPVIDEKTSEWALGQKHDCDLKMTMENGDVLCLRAFRYVDKTQFYATGFMRFISEGKRLVSQHGIYQDKPYSISFDLTEDRIKEAIKKFIQAHRSQGLLVSY